MKGPSPLRRTALSPAPAVLLLLLAAAAFPLEAPKAAQRSTGGVFSLRFDNDFFAGTDRRYTNGIRVAWTSPELGRADAPVRLPRWLEAASRALSFGRAGGRRTASLFLDQRIYTSEELIQTEPPAGEHPYAGYTGVGLAFQSRDADSMDTVGFVLGMVGPHSLAGDTQKLWHKLFGFLPPSGWAYQLKDEPVLGLAYDHLEKVWAPAAGPGLRTDAVVRAGASLSNALAAAEVGAGIRAGWNLPDDFGADPMPLGPVGGSLPESRGAGAAGRARTAVYGYLSLGGQAVLRDIFLDGNSFRDGPRVEKFPFRGVITAGFALRFKRWQLGYGYVFGSRQFETEKRGHIYGTVNLSLAL